MPRYERVVLDTVTISNLIKVGKLDLICELYIDNLCVTEAVIIELGRANIEIENWVKGGRIKRAEFNYGIQIPREISEALSDGEISCIIYGVETDCAIATDDRKARKAVRDTYGHTKLTGTVGLLMELVQEEIITGQYARELLEEMIEKGFWYKGDTPF